MDDVTNDVITRLQDQLKRRFDVALTASSKKSFFLGVYDYIHLFYTDSFLWESIIDSFVSQQRTNDLKRYLELEKLIQDETAVAYKQVRTYFTEHNLSNTVVNEQLSNYDMLLNQQLHISGNFTSNLYSCVMMALRYFHEWSMSKDHQDFLNKYAEFDTRGYVERWTFAPHFDEWNAEETKLKRIEDVTVWHCWDELSDFHNVFINYEEVQKGLIEKHQYMTQMGASLMIDEIRIMMDGRKPSDRIEMLNWDEYKQYLQRFHNGAHDRLDQIRPHTTSHVGLDDIPHASLGYDKPTRTLTIHGKSCQFKENTLRERIMAIVFSSDTSMRKHWNWDELMMKADGIKEENLEQKLHKPQFYTACRGIRTMIALKTGVTDLLTITKQTVRINQSYLPHS